jgi:hypothetical protein
MATTSTSANNHHKPKALGNLSPKASTNHQGETMLTYNERIFACLSLYIFTAGYLYATTREMNGKRWEAWVVAIFHPILLIALLGVYAWKDLRND